MPDGVPLRNVHVAVQIGKEPVGLVRGDADTPRWEIDVQAVAADGGMDLRGLAVHGKRGERFLYLTWGEVGASDSFAMFRRAKLMIGDIEPRCSPLQHGMAERLIASLSLTDECGGPRYAASGRRQWVAVGLNARRHGERSSLPRPRSTCSAADHRASSRND